MSMPGKSKEAKGRYELGKMGLGQIYAGFCCPDCHGGHRWRKRVHLWFKRGKATLRDHRSGTFQKHKEIKTTGWRIYPDPIRRW